MAIDISVIAPMNTTVISEVIAPALLRDLHSATWSWSWRISRKTTVVLAVAVAILLPLLSVAISLWVAWSNVTHEHLKQLQVIARDSTERLDRSIDRAGEVLTWVAKRRYETCSSDHVKALQELVFQNTEIRNIRYQSDDGISCSAVGSANSMPSALTRDWHTRDGMDLWFDHPSALNPDIRSLIVGHLGYGASIDAGAFLGSRSDYRHISLALFDTIGKRVFGVMNDPIVERMRSYIDGPKIIKSSEMLVTRVTSDRYPIVAVVREPIDDLRSAWRYQALIMVPIGAAPGLAISAVVIALARRRLSPRGELEQAVQNREFICDFQPIKDLESGRCIAAEALVRWRRPDGSLVRPDLFIPLAEETGLIRPITEQVVAYVVREAGDLLRQDGEFYISINFAAPDLATDWPLQVIARALKDTNIASRQIAIEVTERGLADIKAIGKTIQALRKAGHRVLIDDFGTGHSNIAYLNSFKVDGIKIDKMFIDSIGTETASSGMVNHIVNMVQDLGISLIAEGVENRRQAQQLAEFGVQYVQGFLYSKPLPISEFRRVLRAT